MIKHHSDHRASKEPMNSGSPYGLETRHFSGVNILEFP